MNKKLKSKSIFESLKPIRQNETVIIELTDPIIENGVYEDDNVVITLDFKEMLSNGIEKKGALPLTSLGMRDERFINKDTSFLLNTIPDEQGLIRINDFIPDCASAFMDHLDTGEVKIFSKRDGKFVKSITKGWWETFNAGGYFYSLPNKIIFFKKRTMSIDR